MCCTVRLGAVRAFSTCEGKGKRDIAGERKRRDRERVPIEGGRLRYFKTGGHCWLNGNTMLFHSDS
jgi:hypothetical protein